MVKKISISLLIGLAFLLLLLVLPSAFGSLPGDVTTGWNGSQVYVPAATSFLTSILIAALFYVLTSSRILRD